MMNRTTIEFWELDSLLDNFEREVANSRYRKMDYAKWRKLTSPLYSGDTTVFLEWDHYKVDINLGGEWHRFVFGDDSFGDFMKCWFLDDIDDENLYPSSITDTALKCGEMLGNSSTAVTNTLEDIMYLNGGLAIRPSSCSDFEANTIVSNTMTVSAETTTKNEENSIMKGFNFDFGPVNPAVVRMSIYGLAVKNKTGTFVSYDAAHEEIMDVDVFNFDGAKFLYKMPVAIKDVAIGDVIVHMNVPMFVTGKAENGKAVYAVDPVVGERKEIMLTKSPFGFNFVTKVINFLGDTLSGGASAENPFGNLGLMMLLSEGDNDVKDMLPLVLMANGGGMDMSNPLVMYALLSGDSKMSGMLPFLLMTNAGKLAAPAHECKCGGNCNHGNNSGENQ